MDMEEQGRQPHPSMGITPTVMDDGGIYGKKRFPPAQPNPLAETGIIDSVHLGERLQPNGTVVDCVVTNPKGKHIYLGDRAV